MNYLTSIHSNSHLIKSFLGRMEFFLFGIKCKYELIVLAYHGTPKKFLNNFEKQIHFFQTHFNIINPEDIESYYQGTLLPTDKPYLLITFDDGIKNNLFAVEILNKYNIKCFFFIVPEFVNTPLQNQKEFFITNIRPLINPFMYSLPEDFNAMNWSELKTLFSQGHAIGNHTSTHTMVASNINLEEAAYEIVTSKETIARNLEINSLDIHGFASINNTLTSVGVKEAKLIHDNYKFHFTTLPGSNTKSDFNPFFIKRANIESFWLEGTVMNAIGCWDRIRWKKYINQYQQIISLSNDSPRNRTVRYHDGVCKSKQFFIF